MATTQDLWSEIEREVSRMTPSEKKRAAEEMDSGSFGKNREADNRQSTENREKDPKRAG